MRDSYTRRDAFAGRAHWLAGTIAVAFLAVAGCALAAEEGAAGEGAPDAAAQFCANIGEAAGNARAAWEARTLESLRSEIEETTAALEAKRVELEEWVSRREAFRKLAEETIVDIYARMRPDAAAAQLAELDPQTAAAVLVKLNARVAGAILSEMDTPRAVSLATRISAGATPGDREMSQ